MVLQIILLTLCASLNADAIDDRVEATIAHAEEFQTLKEGIAQRWQELVKNRVLEVSGKDKDVRPYFVALQGVVEHALAHSLAAKEISSLKGVILTPMPATPLCTAGEISKDLVSSEIESDPQRLFTVKARTTIVREYLHLGGVLTIAYPQGGILKRTEEQRAIYQKELQNYQKNLIDSPLDCESIEPELIGALYLFDMPNGEAFVFAIKMTQAKDPQEEGHFGLWYGPLSDPLIKKRVQKVNHFIEKYAKIPAPIERTL